ncbi:hypothetical protein [Novosphingobium endophyticum]|nr:hypothetical protein [Novosphingobium endophyticum]
MMSLKSATPLWVAALVPILVDGTPTDAAMPAFSLGKRVTF